MPTVSVIIPTYNSSGTLRLELESVLLQDYADFEIWVMGDGCTDDSAAVVASFGDERVQWLNLPKNSGTPSLPRREGLCRSVGKYIAYLGHDDLWFPWHLSQLVAFIVSHPCDWIYALGVLVGPHGAGQAFGLPARAWDHKRAISPSNWLHRRQLVSDHEAWSTKIKLGDDREFLHRLQGRGVRIGFCPTLSVIKFPSTWWKMYARGGQLPQLSYLQSMRQDARELERILLTELGTRMSQQETQWDYTVALPKPLRTLIEWTLDTYGRHRWPLNDFLYWLWRRRAGLR